MLQTVGCSPGEKRSTGSLGRNRDSWRAGRGGVHWKKRDERDHRTSGNTLKQRRDLILSGADTM